jgi:hypothetical protein
MNLVALPSLVSLMTRVSTLARAFEWEGGLPEPVGILASAQGPKLSDAM